MKVTLRQFLEICNKGFIETYIANLYVDEWDADFEEWFSRKKIEHIANIKELEPYMDYEITGFEQRVCYGEIDEQNIYIRKITQ